MYRILSLDGGGLRGLYTIEMLIKIKKDYGIKFDEYFDLIIGTSTGSIIATMLALGEEPEVIKEKYIQFSSNIFNDTQARTDLVKLEEYIVNNERSISIVEETKTDILRDSIFSIGANYLLDKLPDENIEFIQKVSRSKYDINNFRNIVYDYLVGFKNLHLKSKLIIPAVDYTNLSICITKKDKGLELDTEQIKNLTDMIVSSCAAPSFFMPNIVEDNMYIDGGVYANNPSLIGLSDAFKSNNKDINKIKVLSIGTGYKKDKIKVENVLNKTVLDSFLPRNENPIVDKFIDKILKICNVQDNDISIMSMLGSLVETTFRTSSENNHNILKDIFSGTNNYVRINDESIEELDTDKKPEYLLKNIDKLYEDNHLDNLNIFFTNRKLSWWKNTLINISEKLYRMANK